MNCSLASSVLRRMATVVTLFGEKYFLGMEIPTNEAQSIYLMLGGALVAGWGDLEFHVLGYCLIAINCVFTAWYLLAIKRAQSLNLSVFGQILYTNLFAAPIFFVLFLTTEVRGVINFPYWTNPGFLVRCWTTVGNPSLASSCAPIASLTPHYSPVLLPHVVSPRNIAELAHLPLFNDQLASHHVNHRPDQERRHHAPWIRLVRRYSHRI